MPRAGTCHREPERAHPLHAGLELLPAEEHNCTRMPSPRLAPNAWYGCSSCSEQRVYCVNTYTKTVHVTCASKRTDHMHPGQDCELGLGNQVTQGPMKRKLLSIVTGVQQTF